MKNLTLSLLLLLLCSGVTGNTNKAVLSYFKAERIPQGIQVQFMFSNVGNANEVRVMKDVVRFRVKNPEASRRYEFIIGNVKPDVLP